MTPREIKLNVVGDYVRSSRHRAGVQGEGGVTALYVLFDRSWDGYTKKLVWYDAQAGNPVVRMLTTDLLQADGSYLTTVPAEPLAFPGRCTLVVEGYKDGTRARTAEIKLTVDASAHGADTNPVTPTQAEQLQAQIENIFNDIVLAAQAADAKEAARAAQAAAELAQQAAEKAQAGAIAAQTNAQEYRDAAARSRAGADEAKAGADLAKSEAASSAAAAGDAQLKAEAARDAAIQAKALAEAARDAAALARTGAEAARSAAEVAQTKAEANQRKAEESASHAAQAYGLADASKIKAGEYERAAAVHAETANTHLLAAEKAQAAAEAAQRAAEKAQLASEWAQGAAQAILDDVVAAKIDIQESINGVAQDSTGNMILEEQRRANAFLRHISEESGSAGDLNGFGLTKGKQNEVILGYTDPVTQKIFTPVTLPTDTSAQAIVAAKKRLNAALLLIEKGAGQ